MTDDKTERTSDPLDSIESRIRQLIGVGDIDAPEWWKETSNGTIRHYRQGTLRGEQWPRMILVEVDHRVPAFACRLGLTHRGDCAVDVEAPELF